MSPKRRQIPLRLGEEGGKQNEAKELSSIMSATGRPSVRKRSKGCDELSKAREAERISDEDAKWNAVE